MPQSQAFLKTQVKLEIQIISQGSVVYGMKMPKLELLVYKGLEVSQPLVNGLICVSFYKS